MYEKPDKVQKYEEVIADISKEIEKLESERKIGRKKKIEISIFLIFTLVITFILIYITENLRNLFGYTALIPWLLFSVIFFIVLLPRIFILLCIGLHENLNIKYPKIPKSFENMEAEIFSIKQYLGRIRLNQTHFSPDDVRYFTITSIISFLSGLIIYFLYYLEELDFESIIIFIIFILGFIFLSISFIDKSLDW